MGAPLYHEGNRGLQDQFDSRRIADRLEEVTLHDRILPHDRDMIENCDMFFLATADADGWPDVSYKGGLPGFVRMVDDQTLAFPHYDGNGMFKSLGNIRVNPKVGLLFIDFEQPNRMRVQGSASVSADDPLLADFPGAQLIIRVKAERIFPNCPRYIHRMQLVERSVFAPRPRYQPPVPDWKRMPIFNDALPREGPAAVEGEGE
jgi:predicted pyridoxine 5'-phosphate oxidase superfamily flavin-nucleotide-binding protein